MRIERIQASPHKKGRVLVFLEDGACLKITEQELLDFGLRGGDELTPAQLKKLKEAAGVSNTKATAADLIGKRAMSRHDLERKLQEKGPVRRRRGTPLSGWRPLVPSTMQITQQSWCATAPALVMARPAFERNCGRKAYPGSCGTRPWTRRATARSLSLIHI